MKTTVSGPSRLAKSGKHDRRSQRVDGERTRSKILDAAERLYAEFGVTGTSLRKIMETAKVSVSLISYHFGTKEKLIRAIFDRKMREFGAQRMTMLIEARKLNGEEKIDHMLHSFFLSLISSGNPKKGDRKPFLRILGHLEAIDKPWANNIVREFFDEYQREFIDEIGKEFPSLNKKQLYWRLHMLLCIGIYTPVGASRIRYLSGGLVDPNNATEFTENLFPLLISALRTEGHSV